MLDGFLERPLSDSVRFHKMNPLQFELTTGLRDGSLQSSLSSPHKRVLDNTPVQPDICIEQQDIPQYWSAFYQRSLQKILEFEGVLELPGVHMGSSQEVTRWFRSAFYQVFVQRKTSESEIDREIRAELELVFYELGIIKKNALGNWEVSRPGEVIAESSALRSVPETMRVIEEWIQEPPLGGESVRGTPKKLLYLERGPGDGRNMDWVRTQCPNWEYRSIGHVLFFSMTSLLHSYIRPELKNDPDMTMFLRILSIFLMRELDAQPSQDQSINNIFPILAKMGDWIRKYCDKTNGFYVDSNEFEFDTLKKLDEVSPNVVSLFRDFNWFFTAVHFRFDGGLSDVEESIREKEIQRNKEVFLSIFRKTFQPDFCNEIARYLFNKELAPGEKALDLRKHLPVYPAGFTQGYFTDLSDLLTEEDRIGFSSDVRASSHEDNDQFRKDLDGYLDHLENGGAFDLDGGRESYIRDDRSDIVQEIIRTKNAALGREEFRFYAMVEHGSPEGTRARAMWIERAKEDGRFMPPEKLVKCINSDKFEILIGDEYANQFVIRFESEVRRVFKRVFMDRYDDMDRVKQQFGNDAVKKSIEHWVQFISDPVRRPTSLSAQEVVELLEYEMRVQALMCSHEEPQVKEIPAFSSLGVEPQSVDPTRFHKKPSLRQMMKDV